MNELTTDDQTFAPSDIRGLRGVDPQIIMQRVAEGELLRDIAKDYGVSRSAVSIHIAKFAPPETWKQVKEQSIAARLEQSVEAMEAADDQLTLARARETARLWMWRAERELPHLYGQRQQITHEVGPDLGDLLRDARKRVASQQQIPSSSAAETVENCRIIDTTAEVVKDSDE